jgi:hypothetical protein
MTPFTGTLPGGGTQTVTVNASSDSVTVNYDASRTYAGFTDDIGASVEIKPNLPSGGLPNLQPLPAPSPGWSVIGLLGALTPEEWAAVALIAAAP